MTWRRQQHHRPVGCSTCGKAIKMREKHDLNTQTGERFHLTCGLTQLTNIPQPWAGLRVMHPMSQWASLPVWRVDWLEPFFDQGVVQEVRLANWTDESGEEKFDVLLRPDGQNLKRDRECWLRYGAHNLWTRGDA